MIEAVARLADAGPGLPLIIAVLAAGLYLTILLRGLQFRRLLAGLRLVATRHDESEADGDLSHGQALAISLASSIGAGSVVGVSFALVAGGPGALFWLWVAGFLGMATRYAEAVLGVRFRETDVRGEKSGGPMYYLENGVRGGRLGRGLGMTFAAAAVLAALGFGNGVQAHAVAATLSDVSGLPPLAIGGITAFLLGLVVLGGVRSVGRVAGVLVPALLVVYLGVVGLVLAVHAAELGDALAAVLEGAFATRAAGGGVAGYTLSQALQHGLGRGVLSSEAGFGTGAIAAATARTRAPVRQALVAMIGPFVDTMVVATLTGLALLAVGIGSAGAAGAPAGGASAAGMYAGAAIAAQRSFGGVLPGGAGTWLVAASIAAFAFSTMLAWAYYGERSLQYLAGERAVVPFRLLFVGIVPLGSVLGLELLWVLSDVLRGLMAVPNLLGLVVLSGIVVRETRAYFGRGNSAEDQPSNGR